MKKTELFDNSANRYAFDFEHCRFNDGWAQLDTDQDAECFGNWAHPERLHIVSFVEGDITVIKCDDSEEFREQIEKMASFHLRMDGRFQIDPANNSKADWKALGLAGYLH
jgi:hypothetical protein